MKNLTRYHKAAATRYHASRRCHIEKQNHIKFIIGAVAVALICAGCYPKAVGPVTPDGRQLTWAQMNHLQRKEHMRTEVLPRAAQLFKAWRPERFEKIGCSLCHQQTKQTGIYKMPTADLPRLSGDLLLGPEFKKHPDTTRLKLDRLVPLMSEALGLKSFSIVTRTGFGCYSCHLGPNGPRFGN